jgi:hypothetical protein
MTGFESTFFSLPLAFFVCGLGIYVMHKLTPRPPVAQRVLVRAPRRGYR